MNRLHDALEACLRGLDEGQAMDAVLELHPGFATELRPLLEASRLARAEGYAAFSAEIKLRGRARLLERGRELRNRKSEPRRQYIPMWPRVALTLGLVAVLVLTSTGLVSASSGALPGDQLYSVKRTWEDVQLLFVPPTPERDLLESRFEQERLDEIGELLGQRRAAPIAFSGLVMKQQDGRWLVSGIRVSITGSTSLPARPIAAGEPVVITGLTRIDSTVEAQGVRLLQPGSSLPPLQPSDTEGEVPNRGYSPTVPSEQSSKISQARQAYQFSGVVESMQAGAWRINGQLVYPDQATFIGSVKVGSPVKFEGYYNADGKFVVTQLMVEFTPAQPRERPADGSAKDAGDSSGGEGQDHGGGGGEGTGGGGGD